MRTGMVFEGRNILTGDLIQSQYILKDGERVFLKVKGKLAVEWCEIEPGTLNKVEEEPKKE